MGLPQTRPVMPVKDAILPSCRRIVMDAMAARDLSVTGLSARLGVSRKHVSNVLGGKVALGRELAERIADVLDLDADELLCLRHDGLVPRPHADLPPMRVEILGDPNEPIPDWAEP